MSICSFEEYNITFEVSICDFRKSRNINLYINQFFENDFLRTVPVVIHQPYPFHLVSSFQLLIATVSFCKCFYALFKYFI